jgi:hypothetical protein
MRSAQVESLAVNCQLDPLGMADRSKVNRTTVLAVH